MPTTKLTDTQLVILSAASRRQDRGLVLPAKLKGGAAQKLLAKLIDLGLVEEVRARGDLPVWRRDDDNRAMALRITKRGLKAIAVEDDRDAGQNAADGKVAGAVRKKLGLTLVSDKVGDERVYRIGLPQAPKPTARKAARRAA